MRNQVVNLERYFICKFLILQYQFMIPFLYRKTNQIRHESLSFGPNSFVQEMQLFWICQVLILFDNSLIGMLSSIFVMSNLLQSLLVHDNQAILDHIVILDVVKVDVPLLIKENVGIGVYDFALIVLLQLNDKLVVEFIPGVLVARQRGVVTAVECSTVQDHCEQVIELAVI